MRWRENLLIIQRIWESRNGNNQNSRVIRGRKQWKKKIVFSENFVWGAATSAYQIEGAVKEDGKGEHIWDVYTKEPGKVYSGHTGEVACDHYHRYDFLARYLRELKKAAEEADIRGYFQWSLMDNFEWAKGYSDRFGLVYVDYRNQERIMKDSAFWYKHVIETNGAEL